MDATQKRRFLLGVLLAWAPMLFILLTLLPTIFSQRTSGLGAVAGGLSEGLASLGLAAAIAGPLSAILFLIGALSGASLNRWLVAALSIGCAGLTLLMCAFLVWSRFLMRRP